MSHSLTGASSAKRWMNCSGYLHLANQAGEAAPERLDPDFTREGSAAHTVAAWCLKEGKDAWQFTGRSLEGVVIGEGEGQVSPTAIQEYINECRSFLPYADNYWIETPIGANVDKRPHPGFYGTLDFAALIPMLEDRADPADMPTLVIRDLKFGVGVYVEVEHNEQLMYYAYGMLLYLLNEKGIELPDRTAVDLGIVQPRYWEYDGPRSWTTTVGEIMEWGSKTLVPEMERATSREPEYVPGEHCRFCPVKLRCPVMRGMFGAAVKASQVSVDPKAYTDDELGCEYEMIPVVEMFLKALKGEVDYRAGNGRKSPFWKLVKKKMDRVWKTGAFQALRETVGDLAMTAPTLKSPAQMEKVSSYAKQLVSTWAFTPDGGLVSTHAGDRRQPEKSKSIAEEFSDYEGRQF